MKLLRWFRQVCLPLCLLGPAVVPALAEFQVPPAPPRFLFDGAGLLDQRGKEGLENRLLNLNEERGLQIGIGIFPSLEGEPLEDVSLRIAEAWKPGFKGSNDGLLLTVFLKEKKVRIDVGYGLEGSVTDSIAGRIIREQLAPHFRAGQYAGGLAASVDALAAAARGQTLPPPARLRGRGEPSHPAATVSIMAVAILLTVLVLVGRLARSGRVLHGHKRAGDDLPFWLLLLLSQRGPSSKGGFFGGGGGGFFGGGGFGGGSFGGGSFGGGGASGGW